MGCAETLDDSSLPLALDVLLLPFGDSTGHHIAFVDQDAYTLRNRLAFFQDYEQEA
jgi:hypothetical protein